MFRETLKASLSLSMWPFLMFVVLAVPAFGQTTLTIPSAAYPEGVNNIVSNQSFSNIIINPGGQLTGTNLMLPFANFNGPIKVAIQGQTGPAIASLTNTSITLQNSTTGISVNGPFAKLTLGGSLDFPNAGGFSNKVGVTATGGAQVNVLDGSVLTLGFSGNNNIGIHVDGAGTTLTVTNASISLPGTGTDIVVDVTGAASATITGSTLNESQQNGNTNIVLNAAGQGTTLSVTDTMITMSGTNHDTGVAVTGGAVANINGGFITLTTGNNNNIILKTDGTDSMLTVTGTTLSMTNGNNTEAGVMATGGADVQLNSAPVNMTVTGPNNVGLVSNASTIAATGTDISLTSSSGPNNNVGVAAGALTSLGLSGTTGTVTLNGGSVTLNTIGGSNDVGVLASGSGATATLNGTSVTVGVGSASSDAGILVTNSGTVDTTDADVVVNSAGNNSGVQFGGSSQFGQTGGTVSMTSGTVNQTSSSGQAILVAGSGSNLGTFDGTKLTSSGIGAFLNGTALSTLNFENNASLTSTSTGIFAEGSGTTTVNFENGSSLNPGNALLLQVTQNAFVNLNAINGVNLIGNIDATTATGTVSGAGQFPAPANVTLQFGSSLTGWINQNTLTGAAGLEPIESPFPPTSLPRQNVNLGIDGNSVWTMTASSTLNNLTVNPGARIVFTDPPDQPFKTLVINNLKGDGATFAMNVDLGQIKGDLLAIVGTGASNEGTHLVEFANRDQSSDLPVNVALLVVKTNFLGASFSGEADGGTYKYFLRNGDGTSIIPVTSNWYLVRGDQVLPPSPPPVDPNPATPSPRPPDEFTPGEVGPTPEVVVPTPLSPIQDLTNAANAAIGSYSAIMPMFYADMGTLNERLGELRLQTQEQPPPPEPIEQPGKSIVSNGKETKEVAPSPTPAVSPFLGLDFWVRAFGSGSSFYNQASRNFFQTVGGFQFGADKRFVTSLGDVYLGAFLGYFRASRDFLNGDGDGHTDAFSVGAYTTLVHPSGFYADLVVKHTYMWNEFETPTIGEAVSTATANFNLPTVGASLEIGKRWDFGHFFVEPQGQIMGAWAASTSYTASNGLVVNGESQYSLRGRIGLRTGYRFNCGDKIFEPFVTVSGGNEFLGSYTLTTDQTPFNPTLSGASVDAAIGLNARLSRSIYLYGQYDYDYSDKIRTPWAVNLGLSFQW
jgi:outer membrane autotransporter protein